MTDVAQLIADIEVLLDKATPGEWQVITTKHPHFRGGEHVERRIATAWVHPQLKDFDPIVTIGVGLGPEKDGPPTHMVSISEDDADYIAACSPDRIRALLDEVRRLDEERAHYVQLHFEATERAEAAEAEVYALKLAAAGGEDAPGAANAVTVADVERWTKENWKRIETAEASLREAVKVVRMWRAGWSGRSPGLFAAAKATDDFLAKLDRCQCPACRDGVRHASDCAVHNAPAMPVGPCDCGALSKQEPQP